MSHKRKERAVVHSQREIGEGIYDLWVRAEMSADAVSGQFAGLYPRDKSSLLPRPISICQINREEKFLRFVYRIAGKGTREFSALKPGDFLELLGPLGRGFPVEEAAEKRVALIGGGIGIPPMLELAREISEAGSARQIHIIGGYRNNRLFLAEDLERYGIFHTATEDGSAGTKGTVLNVLKKGEVTPDIIMACGPMPMLRALKQYASEQGIPAYISLEEHMACGVGACLGCVCKTTRIDHHSGVKNARICTEGPVFNAEEVDI